MPDIDVSLEFVVIVFVRLPPGRIGPACQQTTSALWSPDP